MWHLRCPRCVRPCIEMSSTRHANSDYYAFIIASDARNAVCNYCYYYLLPSTKTSVFGPYPQAPGKPLADITIAFNYHDPAL